MIQRDNTKVEKEKFLKICDYLDCDLEEFYNEYRKGKTLSMSPSFTEKYHSLDIYGKNAVDSILNIEYNRCAVTENKEKTVKMFKVARSSDGEKPQTDEFTQEEHERLLKAVEMDDNEL